MGAFFDNLVGLIGARNVLPRFKRVQKMKSATGTVVTPIEAATLAYSVAAENTGNILAVFLWLPQAGRSLRYVRPARRRHRCFGAE